MDQENFPQRPHGTRVGLVERAQRVKKDEAEHASSALDVGQNLLHGEDGVQKLDVLGEVQLPAREDVVKQRLGRNEEEVRSAEARDDIDEWREELLLPLRHLLMHRKVLVLRVPAHELPTNAKTTNFKTEN